MEKKIRYYLISTSKEGTFYLVNGWRKYKKYWTESFGPIRNSFASHSAALASYTKLCKAMPEYSSDDIKVGAFLWEV